MCKHHHKVWAFKDEHVTLKMFLSAQTHRKCCSAPSGKKPGVEKKAAEGIGWVITSRGLSVVESCRALPVCQGSLDEPSNLMSTATF